MGKQGTSSNQSVLKRKVAQMTAALSAARGDGLSVKQLKSEQDFSEYMKLLKRFAQRYCVLVVAQNTPCGPAFTQEMSRLVMEIGFKEDLFQKFRCPYAAAVDSGVLVFEQLEQDTAKTLRVKFDLDNNTIELFSSGYNALEANRGLIYINGKNYSPDTRGLNFVVFDKVTQTVLDAVSFDTYSTFYHKRPSEDLERVRQYVANHPGVSVVGFNLPKFPIHDLTPNERFINQYSLSLGMILNNLGKHVFALNQYYDNEAMEEVLRVPTSYHDIHGIRRFEDKSGSYVNIAGGHRVTCYQPKQSERTIFVYGGCCTFGIGAADNVTVASWLQRLFNEKLPAHKVLVQNYGFFLSDLEGMQAEESFRILESFPVKPGDIIVWNTEEMEGFPFIDISDIASQPRNCEVFFDTVHYTPDGYRLIAEKLFEGLTQMVSSAPKGRAEAPAAQPTAGSYSYGLDGDASSELEEYKQILMNYYNEMFAVTIGSVVMNCNPFTLGHRYLVEKALEQCDFLVIFVVQEDKSVFPFEDRLQLVDEGVADLNNVVVVPSGRFVLSSLTFSEYFNKSELQDRIVDASLDITLFAREIAPCLHIVKRFAGEEPLDTITRQYNETMRRILSEYGIEFVEIPRVEIAGGPVSASHVRTLLEKRDFEAIRPLVPQSTFDYLLHHSGKKEASSTQQHNESRTAASPS